MIVVLVRKGVSEYTDTDLEGLAREAEIRESVSSDLFGQISVELTSLA